MKRKKLQASKAGHSLASVVITGVIVALLLSVLLSGVLTNLVLNGRLKEKGVSTSILLVRTISVLIGGLVGGVLLKQKYLLQVALTALGYILALLGIGIGLYEGSFRHFLSGCLSAVAGGTMALVILQRPKNKKRSTVKFSQ